MMMDLDGLPESIEGVKAMVIDEDDPVISEVPVFVNHLQDPPFLCGEIHVLLNTLRHKDRPYGDHGQISSVDFDESNQRLRMEYILDSRSDTYDSTATHALRKHSLIANPTVRDSHAASYCIGLMSEGALTLVPVSSVAHVRPCFDHIDLEIASRKQLNQAAQSKSEESSQNKPLAGKALHYQQLVSSIRFSKSDWRKLDFYDYDSVEAADLVNKHLLVSSVQNLREVKTRALQFTGDQEQYLTRLSAWVEKESSVGIGDEKTGSSSQELARLDFSKQIETIMRRVQVIKFSDLWQSLPPNTRARFSEDQILDQLEACAICVQGVWVVLSHQSPYRPQVWDTRDALLILLHAGREVTIQLLSGINNLAKDEIEEIVRSVCSLDLLSNTWKLKIKPDTDFVASHADIVKRHESVANSIINRLKAKKEQRTSTAGVDSKGPAAFSREEIAALCHTVGNKLMEEGSLTTEEVKQSLQAKTRDHFVSEATALEILREIEAVPVRERWAAPSRGSPHIDSLRRILMGLYRDRDALTKAEIVSAFGECDLTDHDLRKLIKEFAVNEKGYWVFNGAAIAERRSVKAELAGDDDKELF